MEAVSFGLGLLGLLEPVGAAFAECGGHQRLGSPSLCGVVRTQGWEARAGGWVQGHPGLLMRSQADHMTSSQQGAGHDDGAVSPVLYLRLPSSLSSASELDPALEGSKDLKDEGGREGGIQATSVGEASAQVLSEGQISSFS